MDSEEAYGKFITYTFIQGNGHIRTDKLEEYLVNQFDIGVNIYPRNLANTANLIIKYNKYVNNPNHLGKKRQQPNKY